MKLKISAELKDKRTTLETLKELQTSEPFDQSQKLYHLIDRHNLELIKSQGLIPKKPKASQHGGVLKGELFAGIWLSRINDLDLLVDIHQLPHRLYYDGIILEVDGTQLNPESFSIGIEIPYQLPEGEKISRNKYFQLSDEIVYLERIPVKALKGLS